MTDKELYEKFAVYAHDHGWTIEESAKNIGVGRTTLFNYKNGHPISARVRQAMLVLVAEAIPPPAPITDKLLQHINEEWGNLSAEARGQIICIIEKDKERKKNTTADIYSAAE